MTAQSNLSLHLVERHWTKTVFRSSGAAPLSRYLLRKTIDESWDDMFKEIIAMVGDNWFSLTFDALSRYSVRYHAAVVHYINREDMSMKSLLLGLTFCKRTSISSSVLRDTLYGVAERARLDMDRCIGVCTDNASDMALMRRMITEEHSTTDMACASHFLAVVMAEAASVRRNAVLAAVLWAVRRVVGYFRNTPTAMAQLNEIIAAMIGPGKELEHLERPLTILGSCATRWGTRIVSLERFLLLLPAVRKFFVQYGGTTNNAKNYVDNFKTAVAYEGELNEIVRINYPVAKAMVALQADKKPTLSEVVPGFTDMIETLAGLDKLKDKVDDQNRFVEDEAKRSRNEAERRKIHLRLIYLRERVLNSKKHKGAKEDYFYPRRAHEVRKTKIGNRSIKQVLVEWHGYPEEIDWTWEPTRKGDTSFEYLVEHFEAKGSVEILASQFGGEHDGATALLEEDVASVIDFLDERTRAAFRRGDMADTQNVDPETVYVYKKQENEACSKIKVPTDGIAPIARNYADGLLARLIVSPLFRPALGDWRGVETVPFSMVCAVTVACALDPHTVGLFQSYEEALPAIVAFAKAHKIIKPGADINRRFESTVLRVSAQAKRRKVTGKMPSAAPDDEASFEDKLEWVIKTELQAFYDDCNSLGSSAPRSRKWWSLRSADESTTVLQEIAFAVYSLPATQASVERAFSIVAQIAVARRNKLQGTAVERLAMLSWYLGRLESDHNSDPDVIVLTNVNSNGEPTLHDHLVALCAEHGLDFSSLGPEKNGAAFADYTAMENALESVMEDAEEDNEPLTPE